MVIRRTRGRNYYVGNCSITIFGLSGFIKGGAWWVNTRAGYALTQVRGEFTFLPVIEECLAAASHTESITTLRLSPDAARLLYLQGVLTRKYFRKASESDGTINLPQVQINGRQFTVKIVGQQEAPVLVGADRAR